MRLEAGLTVRELARLAGTSHSTIVAYEQGRKIPRADTRDRLIEAAGFVVGGRGPRRVRHNAQGQPRDVELQEVIRMADAIQESKRQHKPHLGPGARGRMPVFPPRLGT